MTIPTFDIKNETDDSPQRFVEVLASTGKFWRNARSQILFQLGRWDYTNVATKDTLRAILADAGAVKITGFDINVVDDAVVVKLWRWLTAYTWKLPRAGGPPTGVES